MEVAMKKVALKKLSPVLLVDAIEPLLPLFTERLGLDVTVEVPHDKQLGFVILAAGDVEVMLQTRASARDDVPAIAGAPNASLLYFEVADLDPVVRALDDAPGVEVAVPRRRASYGADEIFYRLTSGHFLGFAKPAG
jgi:hypothetical protein